MTYVLCPYCGRIWETNKTIYAKCPKCGKQVFVPWNKVKPTTTSSSTTKTTTNTTSATKTTTNTTTTLPPTVYAVHEDQVSRIRSSKKHK